MPATYEPIATTTLSTTAASITFSSITSAYTDLKIILVGTTTLDLNPRIQFNSDTASNYSYRYINGDGATAATSAASSSIGLLSIGNIDTTIPGFLNIDIFSYTGSTRKIYFSAYSLDKNTGTIASNCGKIAGVWTNTAAITSVTLDTGGSTFKAGTTATLYGILKA